MTVVRIKGLHIYRDRHGKTRCYHRATRMAIDLDKMSVGSAAFLIECDRLCVLAKKRDDKNAAIVTKASTLGALIEDYRESEDYRNLALKTKRDYQTYFDWLRPIVDRPLAKFNRSDVMRLRDEAAKKGWAFANCLKSVLSLLFSWGSQRGLLESNPAAGIKKLRRPKDAPPANRAWADEERDVVLAEAPEHVRPLIALMMFTGLGPKDAVALTKTSIKDGEISTSRAKTGEPVFWPMPGPLAAILHAAPNHSAVTVCANMWGRPWSKMGFSSSWRDLRDRLEQEGKIAPGLTLYGLRHTVAVILRESGADERTIADALGQRTTEMARHYAQGADLTRKMRGVVKQFDVELARRKQNKI
jgi:integrase